MEKITIKAKKEKRNILFRVKNPDGFITFFFGCAFLTVVFFGAGAMVLLFKSRCYMNS